MPEGLLRGGGPGTTRAETHWLILPLSIAAHAAAAIAVVVVPLVTTLDMPSPYQRVHAFIRTAEVRPLEIPPPRGGGPAPARAVPAHAPATLSTSEETPAPEGSGFAGDPLPGLPTGTIGGAGSLDGLVTVAPPVPPAPPPPAERVLMHVGGVISPPRKTVHVAPVYPRMARDAQVGGTVILEAVINEQGEIERLKVLRSVPLLDAAAIEAVSGWRYTPTLLNNVPVPVLMTITVTFSLRE